MMSYAMLMPRYTFTDSEDLKMSNYRSSLGPVDVDDPLAPVPGSMYDPFFTAHVSTSMRVPERIAVSAADGEDDSGASDARALSQQYNIGRSAAEMNVPDRIVVAGQDRHIGLKEDLRLNLDFDPADLDRHNSVAIQTPPRVLTLQDRPFPTIDEEGRSRAGRFNPATPRQLSARSNGVKLTSSPSLDLSSSMDGLLLQDSDVDDAVVIRRQLLRLTRRLMHLEEENNKRSQREMVIYPVMIGYVLFQFAKWFLQNN